VLLRYARGCSRGVPTPRVPCKQYGIDPEKWLNDVLNRINDHKVSRLEELMPQYWKPAPEKMLVARNEQVE